MGCLRAEPPGPNWLQAQAGLPRAFEDLVDPGFDALDGVDDEVRPGKRRPARVIGPDRTDGAVQQGGELV